ncbi:MAG: ribonuclease III [Bacillota bacterium]|jgi:ribonuclease-3|nr:ribonuclease III [Bacillota bacterium]NLL26387.1 ribonuclease III [Erysipelotrichia bacterium]
MSTIYNWLKKNYNITIKNRQVMENAFTHASYLNENKDVKGDDYERIEFLGDAIVGMWVANKLYHHNPEIDEGKMTTMRAQIVCEKSLADFLRKLDLAKYIKMGVGEEKSGARNRNSLLADIFEAFIGAVYLNGGMKDVNEILKDAIDIVNHPELFEIIDYKSRLQEYVQSDTRAVLKYELLSETGPSNNPLFEMGVFLDEVLLGKGTGKTKKKAEQSAAEEALRKLVK